MWKYYYEWVQKYGINFVFSSYFPGCPLVKQKDGSYYYNNTLMDDTEIKNTIVLKSTSSKEKIRKYILNTMNVDSMTPMQYTIMTSIKKLINDTKEKY